MKPWYTCIALGLLFSLARCGDADDAAPEPPATPAHEGVVVLYCAWDDQYSKPIAEDFQKETGITVSFVGDQEATKTSGLRQRLIAEQANPQADVFWNNELGQTHILMKEGVVAPFVPEHAKDIAPIYRDPAGFWTGIAARARCIIVNTDVLAARGWSPEDVTGHASFHDPRFKDLIVMAAPKAGTTATHVAALYARPDFDAGAYFERCRTNGLKILPSNSQVAAQVAAGNFLFGWTDTDDYQVQKAAGKPVARVFPDQRDGGLGTLVLPNTIMLIKGAPHPQAAKLLINYLTSPAVERRLAQGTAVQAPCNPTVEHQLDWHPSKLVTMNEYLHDGARVRLDFAAVADRILDRALPLAQALEQR